MAQDDVDIRVRMRGAKQAERDAKGVASGLDRVGASSRRAGAGLAFLKGAGRGISSTLSDFGGAARRGALTFGTFATATAAFAGKQGLQFNATMEQNTIAFANFLGSTRAAKAYLSDLYNVAARTPFEFPELTEAAVKLMGFGMSAKQTRSLLVDLGDAVAGVGGGSEQIQAATLALGQMQAKGKVSMEELNQLTEARIPALKILKKELGLSSKQMARLGQEGIPASKAIPALQRGLRKMFGGQAARQAKTFNGQVSTLKDNLNQTLGSVTHGGFVYLRDKVFPDLNRAAEDVGKTFQRTDLDFGAKLRVARGQVQRDLRPLAREVETELRNANLGDKLADFVEAAAPKIADAAARSAPRAASAFVHAFVAMGPWAKLLTVGLIAKRLGVFRVAGRIASDRFVAAFAARATAGMAAEGVGTGVATAFAGTFVAALGPALLGAGIGAAIIYAATRDLTPGATRDLRKRNSLDSTKAHHPVDPRTGLTGAQIYGRRTHDPIPANTEASRGYQGIPQTSRRGSARPRTLPKRPPLAALPRARGAHARETIEVHAPVIIDGREVARAVHRHDRDAGNRK
jgi:tape measure domain-containing protein